MQAFGVWDCMPNDWLCILKNLLTDVKQAALVVVEIVGSQEVGLLDQKADVVDLDALKFHLTFEWHRSLQHLFHRTSLLC